MYLYKLRSIAFNNEYNASLHSFLDDGSFLFTEAASGFFEGAVAFKEIANLIESIIQSYSKLGKLADDNKTIIIRKFSWVNFSKHIGTIIIISYLFYIAVKPFVQLFNNKMNDIGIPFESMAEEVKVNGKNLKYLGENWKLTKKSNISTCFEKNIGIINHMHNIEEYWKYNFF